MKCLIFSIVEIIEIKIEFFNDTLIVMQKDIWNFFTSKLCQMAGTTMQLSAWAFEWSYNKSLVEMNID